MIEAFLALLAVQLVGEFVQFQVANFLPGPVWGLVLMTGFIALVSHTRGSEVRLMKDLEATAQILIDNMGLLFVPAGVGVVRNYARLGASWPWVIGIIVLSTALTLVTTALVFVVTERLTRTAQRKPA